MRLKLACCVEALVPAFSLWCLQAYTASAVQSNALAEQRTLQRVCAAEVWTVRPAEATKHVF